MRIGKLDLGTKPVLLAPLEDITDSAFRGICRQAGADMVYSEFVSSEALVRSVSKSTEKIRFDESESPIGIQIFGNQPEAMAQAAKMAEELNPALIDINFGCPVRKIAMKGAGSALLRDVPLLLEITRKVVKAVNLPVTVKTRLGWDENSKIITELAEPLQDTGIQALTVHGRTRSQMYSGQADWSLIAQVKENPRLHIPIIGNGDIDSAESALHAFEKYGVDAIMVGRAAIGRPWIFHQIRTYLDEGILLPGPTLDQRVQMCIQHLRKAALLKGEHKACLEMRKHYSGYFHAIPGFKKIRMQLLALTQVADVEQVLNWALGPESDSENHFGQ